MIDVIKIKKLRQLTRAGIADCRQALESNKGDLSQAQSWLKKKGLTSADQKKQRQTKQGLIEAYVHAGGKIGVILELNCETDFVAHTSEFKHLAHELVLQISAMNPKTVVELVKQAYIRDEHISVNDLIKLTIAKLGENISVRNFYRLELGK